METLVYLSLGSNMDDRLYNLNRAIDLIEKESGRIHSKASVYVSEAMGFEGPPFLNTVIGVFTNLKPQALLKCINGIELRLGRKRVSTTGYTSRTIDIDIILYGDLTLRMDDLVIPHPRYHTRRFVLEPLSEIAGDLLDPEKGTHIKQLHLDCEDKSPIFIYRCKGQTDE